jgi:hypothetical protein
VNKLETNRQQQVIPCAICGTAAALRECAIRTSAFGLGEIIVYLCQRDYKLVKAKLQAEETQLRDLEQERIEFQQMRQEVAALGLRLHGGHWPSRRALWDGHRNTEEQHAEARMAYQQADDNTDEGKMARLRVLRLAGLCLYEAICIEAVAALEETEDSAVSGTLTVVTYAFMRGGGLTFPEKTITRTQVIAAMLTVLRYREAHPDASEKEELAALRGHGGERKSMFSEEEWSG